MNTDYWEIAREIAKRYHPEWFTAQDQPWRDCPVCHRVAWRSETRLDGIEVFTCALSHEYTVLKVQV